MVKQRSLRTITHFLKLRLRFQLKHIHPLYFIKPSNSNGSQLHLPSTNTAPMILGWDRGRLNKESYSHDVIWLFILVHPKITRQFSCDTGTHISCFRNHLSILKLRRIYMSITKQKCKTKANWRMILPFILIQTTIDYLPISTSIWFFFFLNSPNNNHNSRFST